ncbi:MAG: GDP-mannose 4,6-dehydratase [Eubacterium sp.]|nr:GDP-mannose 4,6-dehydratase [Eubacterium sp.]
MRSLIIGGAGFVGSYLVRHLITLGHEAAVTKMPTEEADLAGAAIYDLDILDKEAVVVLLDKVKPDLVFHLAAQSSVSMSWRNPQQTIDVNVRGSTNVLDALCSMGKKARILLVGSGEEYGQLLPEEIPVRETNLLRPANIYAATKACQNMIGRIYAKAYGMDIVMVRAFNHIGPNQSPIFAIADFCRQAVLIEAGMEEPILRVGNLEARRDFTDVRDVVRAYALLAEQGQAGETYNIGSGHAVSIADVLRIVLEQSTAMIRVEVDEKKLRPVDVPVMEANVCKVWNDIGWKSEIRLEQTIGDMMEYWRKMINSSS